MDGYQMAEKEQRTMMKNLLHEFEKLKTDEEKWIWVINNQENNIIVNLDNDGTFITIKGNDDDYGDFIDYIGWSDGIFSLLKAIGIKCEGV